MKFGLLFSAFLAAGVSLVMSGAATAAAQDSRLLPGTFELHVEAGLLNLEAHDARVSEVVRAIGDRVGFKTRVFGDLTDSVSTSFEGISVSDGLDRLIRDVNWVVHFAPPREGSDDRTISQLWLFASTEAVDRDLASTTEPLALDDGQQQQDRTRANAILRLANSDAKEEVLERLMQVLWEDEDAFARSRGATALGALQDERAVPALESALEDEHASVRIQAIHALGQIGGERATMTLGDVLLYSAQRMERIRAAWALGRQDTELAQSFLDAVADDPDNLVWTASRKPPVRARRPNLEAPPNVERRGSNSIK